MFISGSLPRGDSTTGRGRPRAPRRRGDVDRQLLAPVAVDLGDRHPAPVEEAGLHRVLGVVAVDDRHGGRRVGSTSRPPCGTRARRRARPRHPGQVHAGGRARAGVVAALAGEVLIERVAEQVACARRRSPRRSRRSAGRRTPAPAGTPGGPAWRRHRWPTTSGPAPSRGRRAACGSAVLAISAQNTCRRPPTSSPPSGQNQRLRIRSPVPGSNDVGAVAVPRWSSVKQAPCCTIAVLWANEVWSRRGGPAGVVDEGVLEQPQVAVAAERVDVLVVVADDRADALAEEGVERGRPRCRRRSRRRWPGDPPPSSATGRPPVRPAATGDGGRHRPGDDRRRRRRGGRRARVGAVAVAGRRNERRDVDVAATGAVVLVGAPGSASRTTAVVAVRPVARSSSWPSTAGWRGVAAPGGKRSARRDARRSRSSRAGRTPSSSPPR